MRYILALSLLLLTQIVSGQFSEFQELTKSMASPEDHIMIDYDSDGDKEVFVVSFQDHKVSCFENLGGGLFSEQITIYEGLYDINRLEVLDYDADGLEDIIFDRSSAIGWLKNNGDGTLADPEFISIIPFSPKHTLFDIDNDGHFDILYQKNSDELVWARGLDDGSFGDEILIDDTFEGGWRYDLEDIDGDGDSDLAIAIIGGDVYDPVGGVTWYENNGDGFESGMDLTTDAYSLSGLKMLDFDGDSDNDILIARNNTADLVWYENLDGAGDFGAEETLIEDFADYIWGIAVFDVDNDSDIDVVVTGSSPARTSLFRNDGTGGLEPEIILNNYLDNYLILCDINGDVYPELISANNNKQVVCILPNDAGVFGTRHCLNQEHTFAAPNNLVAVDIDVDGKVDILGSSRGDHRIGWYRQSSDMEFEDLSIIDSNIIYAVASHVADLDNDGIVDILYASEYNNRIYWKKNLGGGLFGPRDSISADVNEPVSLITLDYDGDGDLDVLSASVEDNKIASYENFGDGTFGPQEVISTTNEEPQMLKSGDVDGDGLLDIVCISYEDGELTWYKNIGDGTFSSENMVSDEVNGGNSIWLVDLDDDLDLDIISTGYNHPEDVSWFENDGEGNFGSRNVISSPIDHPMFVVSADIDLDNDQDVIFATYQAFANRRGRLFVAYNDGEENFTTPYKLTEHRFSQIFNVLVADFESDLDYDILYADQLKNQVNLTENFDRDLYQVRGDYYVDENNNGLRDSFELSVPDGQVLSSPEAYFSYTYLSGTYLLNFDESLPGLYEVFPDVPDFWEVSSDSSTYHVLVDDSFEFTDSLDFGIHPEIPVDTLSCEITGGFPRCNTIINYWLTINNEGTTIPSGVAHLELDENVTYVYAEMEPDSIIGQNIYWAYDSLYYFDNLNINIQVEMPDFMALGDTLTSMFFVTADSEDEVVFETVDILSQILVCAYDPNDKIAEPTGVDSLGFVPPDLDYIDYTIRFQNTGNDTAVHVRIEDQLDPSLKWHTLTPLAYSHDMTASVYPDGRIVFFFGEIMLPDSNVNEIASHGFIKYRIYLEDDLPLGTQINNTAEIYFDSNPAVITNTEIHTLFDCNSIMESLVYETISCQGELLEAGFELYTSTTETEWSIDGIGIYHGSPCPWEPDTAGIFEINVNVSTDFCTMDSSFLVDLKPAYVTNLDTLYICFGDSILIYDSFESVSGNYYKGLESTWSCDSTLVTYLNVLLPTITEENTFFCEDDSVIVFGEYVNEIGLYYDTLSNYLGCDSIIEMTVSEMDRVYFWDEIIECPEVPVLIFDEYRTIPGIYNDTLVSALGCDSISSIELIHLEVPEVTLTPLPHDLICDFYSTYTLYASPSGGLFHGPGITDDKFSPETAGIGAHVIYYSFEDDIGCVTTDSIIAHVVDCLGIEQEKENQITLYPNPFSDFTVLNFGRELNEIHSIVIYDMLGKEVYRNDNVTGSSLKIESKNLVSGLYILSLFSPSSEEIFTTKLLVE